MRNIFILMTLFIGVSCKKNDPGPSLVLNDLYGGPVNLSITSSQLNVDVPIDQLLIADFSTALDTATVKLAVSLSQNNVAVAFKISYLNNLQTISVKPLVNLLYNQPYQLKLSTVLKGRKGESFSGVTVNFTTIAASLNLISFKVDGVDYTNQSQVTNISLSPSFEFNFSTALNQNTSASNFFITGKNPGVLNVSLSNQNKTLTLKASNQFNQLDKYATGILANLTGSNGEIYKGYTKSFYTKADPIPKFPTITDDQLLDLVQKQTLKYFYDFGHPTSGMARERDTSGDIVTTGGSGFGLMALVVGINRGFISRADGVARFNKIITFLEKADRFHGAWPHWMNGNTGKVIPFSTNDDGADLVETSYMAQGLITVRQYLTASDTVGNNLINRINTLWKDIEWDWFRKADANGQNPQNVLYWHWSPDKAWIMNFPLYGYFEEQITYFMAAASPTHTIPLIVYTNGFTQNGGIKTGNTYTYNGESYVLPLGTPSPLFWVQYSYLGLNPHFTDNNTNTDYWVQNVNASLINHAYCAANPKKFVAYSDSCWGLTASDNPTGYNAQSPANDNGTISPTAALSSMPYTPTQSINAMKFFYYTLGDRLWGPYGFYDAFNISSGWTATSTLAIDQGPIIVMIENYRTQLLWNLFESAPEVQAAKTKLGFTP
jgi:hypothetical protein